MTLAGDSEGEEEEEDGRRLRRGRRDGEFVCECERVCVCADQQREMERERERPSFPAALFPRSLTHIACDGKRGRERAREVAAFLILNPFREVERERGRLM